MLETTNHCQVSSSAMIRNKLWKQIIRDGTNEELYDLMYDPNEVNNLIDIYGGALTSISIITNHIIKQSGTMRQLLKDRRSILFEQYKGITGILISDYNSIELKHKLQIATNKFYQQHAEIIDRCQKQQCGISIELDIRLIIPIFRE